MAAHPGAAAVPEPSAKLQNAVTQHRILIIIGAPGSGKSDHAHRLHKGRWTQQADEPFGPGYMLPCASVISVEQFLFSLAQKFNVDLIGNQPTAKICTFLATLNNSILFLDNLNIPLDEQLLPLFRLILQHTELRIVITPESIRHGSNRPHQLWRLLFPL